MNKNVAVGLAIAGAAVVVAATFATPFLALKRVADAVEARDPDQLDLLVDFAAVRAGLKDQVKVRAMKAGDDDPATALAAVFVPDVVNAVVDGVVTPRGVIHLVSTGRIEGAEESQLGAAGAAAPNFRLHKARYLGLSRFRATIGPGEASTVEVVLDRSGLFGWKVTRINLLDDPPASPPASIPAEQATPSDESPLPQSPAVVDTNSKVLLEKVDGEGVYYDEWFGTLVSAGRQTDVQVTGEGKNASFAGVISFDCKPGGEARWKSATSFVDSVLLANGELDNSHYGELPSERALAAARSKFCPAS